MSIIRALLGPDETRSERTERWWGTVWPTSTVTSGAKVSEEGAVKFTAVLAAVRLISETVASLPLQVYRKKRDGSKEQIHDHWTYPLLHTSPNKVMTSMNWRESMQALLCTWGNCYSRIVTDSGQRRVEQFKLIPASEVTPKWTADGEDVEYVVGKPGQPKDTIRRQEMFHVPGLGFNGLVGFSPIRMAKEAIGLGLAAEEFAARFFGKGATPAGVLQHPAKLDPESFDNLKKSFEEQQAGLENAWKALILEQGMEWKSISMPMTDAQLLESRQFSVVEVARIFNLPPHLLRDLSKASFSNIEEENLHFAILSVRPWLVRWEQVLKKQVFDAFGLKDMYAEFNLEGLLRGRQKDRFESYRIARNWGWMSVDEIRKLENMNPLPNGQGKHHLMPMNMWDIARIDELPVGKGAGGAPPRSRYQKILERACEELVRREVNAARREIKLGPDSFGQWADSFYAENVEQIRDRIEPAVDGYCDECSVPIGQAARMAADMCSLMRQAVRVILDEHRDNKPVSALARHYGEWRSIGAGTMADYIISAIEEQGNAVSELPRLPAKRPDDVCQGLLSHGQSGA